MTPRAASGPCPAPAALPRRGFLAALAAPAVLAGKPLQAGEPLEAAEPLEAGPPLRAGAPHVRLALAAYGFRDFFTFSRGRPQAPADAARSLSIASFIDLCADLGCDAELTAYYFDPATDEAALAALRRRAHLRGVAVTGCAVGNTFTLPPGPRLDGEIADVKRWIDRTAALGGGHLRVFAGAAEGGLSLDDARRQCIAALRECCGHAATRGVLLGVENHGGIVADPDGLLAVVEGVDSAWLGINLDGGNFVSADPYADLERCAPWAVNVQYKASIRRGGEDATPEPADARRVLSILARAGYQGPLVLEYEDPEDPFVAVPRQVGELRAAIAEVFG